jgi:hypothetical protein
VIAAALIGGAGVAYLHSRGDWVEVDQRTFERRVLQARTPALVYFDTAAGCRGGDTVFRTLSRQRRGVLEVFYVNSADQPALARAYGVEHDVVFVLFDGGKIKRRATAPMILAAVTARNGGVYSDEAFLTEVETFADLRPR